MDVYQVGKCQELIRDNMVVYKNSLECILAIVDNNIITDFSKIHAIREICKATLDYK